VAAVLILAVGAATYAVVWAGVGWVRHHLGDRSVRDTPVWTSGELHVVAGLAAVAMSVAVAGALVGRRATTAAWATGAAGERVVARHLLRAERRGVAVLHDRRLPGTRANIDHIAVGPGGVYVIDAKVVRGPVTLRRTGILRRHTRLAVGGRDRTSMAHGMAHQVEVVHRVLARRPGADGVAVTPAVVLVGGELSRFGRARTVHGVWTGRPRELVALVRRPGPLDATDVVRVARALAGDLPPA
jgi:hypothetical protein